MQQSTHFCSFEEAREAFRGKRVVLVGSGPGVLNNEPGFVDAHPVVCRVNNFKNGPEAGYRTDVFCSFFGGSIRADREELQRQGVKLCVAKCPDAQFMESEWHRQRGKMNGVDFRYIYQLRRSWWFCPTYVPTLAEFMASFHMLGDHVPTSGFAAALFILACEPGSLYLTGFDFFSSGVHNVNEPWRAGDSSDPIGHAPERELQWIADNASRFPITVDPRLSALVTKRREA